MLKDLNENWTVVEPVLSIRDDAEYETAMARVDALIDQGALNLEHPIHSLLNVLGTLIHAYEEMSHPMPAISSVQMLRFLMEQHGLKPTDLPEMGTQSVVSFNVNPEIGEAVEGNGRGAFNEGYSAPGISN